jgi:hypothetical protein
VNSIFVETKNEDVEAERIFRYFQGLLAGSEVRVARSDVEDVLEVASFLGNGDLMSAVGAAQRTFDLDVVLDRLGNYDGFGAREIVLLASHF